MILLSTVKSIQSAQDYMFIKGALLDVGQVPYRKDLKEYLREQELALRVKRLKHTDRVLAVRKATHPTTTPESFKLAVVADKLTDLFFKK